MRQVSSEFLKLMMDFLNRFDVKLRFHFVFKIIFFKICTVYYINGYKNEDIITFIVIDTEH